MSTLRYEIIIGCEIHVQLLTNTKAFCSCENKYGGMPNTKVCPVCLGLPGALPRVNQELIKKAIIAGHALECTIASKTKFDRKNYMYPDLPKGYQISQFDMPICENGHLDITTQEGRKRIGIIRLHMEEDAGKNLHIDDSSSYVDFNRSGTPLIEIVSKPDMRSPLEAVTYVQGIREIMLFLGVSDCNMEEGSLRCDANINLWIYEDDKKYATPISEIKNMNSFKGMKTALTYEVERQLEDWKKNRRTLEMVGKETRGYDEKTGETVLQRSKEGLADYRYFPEPDLKPIILSEEFIEEQRKHVTELPYPMRLRFMEQYQLPLQDVETLTSTKQLSNYFEETVRGYPDAKKATNWILSEVLGVLNETGVSIENFIIKPSMLRELLQAIDSGDISGKIAKDVFAEMKETGKSASEIIAKNGYKQVLDSNAIASIVNTVFAENPKAIEDFINGKSNAVGFLMGQVMKKSSGSVNPKMASDLVNDKLKSLQ